MAKAKEMIYQMDANHDGLLDFDEFVLVMTEGAVNIAEEEKRKAELAKGDSERAAARKLRLLEKARAEEEDFRETTGGILSRAWGVDTEGISEVDDDAHTNQHPYLAAYLKLAAKAGELSYDKRFVNFMTFVICVAGVLVGVNTDLNFPGRGSLPTYPALDAIDAVILVVFSFEVALKIIAQGRHPLHYFHDNWNKFDFFVVFMCDVFAIPGLPKVGSILAMLRLLRLLRVLKLIKAFPELRILIEALISGFSSIFFVLVILFVFYFVYANIGLILFARNDPSNFGNLQMCLLSLFRVATFDNWSDLL